MALHSFTPVFKGVSRPWHVAVLFNRDPRLAHALADLLRAEGDLMVGENEPYRVSDLTDYTVPVHGERRGLPHVEIEIRQDLITDRRARANGPNAWRACCPPPMANSCADERTEPRGADRPGPRRIADHRRSELLRGTGSGKDRVFPSEPARHRAAEYPTPAGRLPARRIEVMYSVIENMTRDGRDRSLDYKISGIDVPRGSWEAQVLDEIAPADDEMIFRKTSSNVFISTNIDYVLRNLGVRSLIVAGIMTDQCVESAVRDACDLGYLVTLVTDACTTSSAERHEQSLIGIRGYCRQRTTDALLAEIAGSTQSHRAGAAIPQSS